MLYKFPHLEVEYDGLHPKVRDVMKQLEVFCQSRAYAEPMATHIHRSVKVQEEFYWRSLMKANKCTEAKARELARAKFTWHFVFCAIDLRDWVWKPHQVPEVLKFLKSLCDSSEWECLYHDVGQGMHLHVGYKDYQWCKTYQIKS